MSLINPRILEVLTLKTGLKEYLPVVLDIVLDSCSRGINEPPEETRELAYKLVGKKYIRKDASDYSFIQELYEKHIEPRIEEIKKFA